MLLALVVWWSVAGMARVSTITPSDHTPMLPLADPLLTDADWPGWRGGFRQGTISANSGLPLQWVLPSATTVSDKHQAVSPPAVAGDAIYVVRRESQVGRCWLTCLDRSSGRLHWRAACEQDERSPRSSLLPTPACDGTRVFVATAARGQLLMTAWAADGRKLWSRPVGPMSRAVGPAQSPVVSGSHVLIAVDQKPAPWDWSGGGGYVAAVHRQTGQIVWRTPRDLGDGFATPVVAEVAGRRQVVLPGFRCIQAYDAATGRELWKVRWPARTVTGAVACDDQHVFATTAGVERETVCIRGDGTGDVTETHVLWRVKYAGSGGAPALIEGGVVVAQEDGGVTALDRLNGRVLWQQRLSERFTMAPLSAGSRLYCLDDAGGVTVLDANQHGQLIAHSQSTLPHAVAVSADRWLFVSPNGLTMITPEGPTKVAHEMPVGRSQR